MRREWGGGEREGVGGQEKGKGRGSEEGGGGNDGNWSEVGSTRSKETRQLNILCLTSSVSRLSQRFIVFISGSWSTMSMRGPRRASPRPLGKTKKGVRKRKKGVKETEKMG